MRPAGTLIAALSLIALAGTDLSAQERVPYNQRVVWTAPGFLYLCAGWVAIAGAALYAEDYAQFVTEAPREEVAPDPKVFAARQAAARAALAHMAELAEMASGNAGSAPDGDADAVLQRARADLAEEEGKA